MKRGCTRLHARTGSKPSTDIANVAVRAVALLVVSVALCGNACRIFGDELPCTQDGDCAPGDVCVSATCTALTELPADEDEGEGEGEGHP